MDHATALAGELAPLIYGYCFAPGSSGRSITMAEACQWLESPAPQESGQFLWLHFNLAHAGAQRWLQEHLDLPPEFFEALRDGSRSTRIEHVDSHLLAVVNDVVYDFAFGPSEIATLWLSADQRLMVSARLHPLRSIDRLRTAVNQNREFRSTVDLLVHLMHDQGDVLVKIVREATARVDEIEDKLLAGHLTEKRANLGALRRVMVRLQRLLAPEPSALFRLLNQPPAWILLDDIQELRQSTEEFSMVLRDMTGLQERIRLLQEEIAALVSEQTNRSVFTLTALTVLALPINLVAGLLGMNVGGIPLSQNPHGFLIIALVVASFTLVVGYFALLRRRRD